MDTEVINLSFLISCGVGDSSTDDDSVGNEGEDLDDQDSGTPPERGDRNCRTASDTPTQQVLIHSDSSSTGSARETPPMQRPPKLPERNRYVLCVSAQFDEI